MAPDASLQLRVLTPHACVFARTVTSLRFPTESGQVGVRARREPFASVVEPGLWVLQEGGRVSFGATAGGFLRHVNGTTEVFTPFAVFGATTAAVMDALASRMAAPDSELSVRRRLIELEQRILREAAQRPDAAGVTSAGKVLG